MKILILAALTLTACASHPPFRKLEGDVGYTVKETPIKEVLDVELLVPASTPEPYRLSYLARVAGEECAARNFSYFDFGTRRTGGARVFCFEKGLHSHLAATIDPRVSNGPTPLLRVEDTEMGKFSPFKPWDVIRKVNGRTVADMAELKEALFLAGRQDLKRVPVLVERSEIPLSLTSPLVESGSGLSGPEQLKDLRTKIP